MQLYLYLIDGIPRASTNLDSARAELEAKLRERKAVSDVWWDDEVPYIPRQYLCGKTHADYLASEDPMEDDISWEMEDQLIFPVEIDPPFSTPSPLDPLGTRMTLSVVTSTEKAQMIRVVPQQEWGSPLLDRAMVITVFAAEAAYEVAKTLRSKEGS